VARHAGLDLQTLQGSLGCLGWEAFLEIFSSSDSMWISKLRASDCWHVSPYGWPPAGKGKGWGQRGWRSDDRWQEENISLALLRPVVSNIDACSLVCLCQIQEGGQRVKVGQGGPWGMSGAPKGEPTYSGSFLARSYSRVFCV
jgi:hypothetical protein